MKSKLSCMRELDFEGREAGKNHPGGHLEGTRTPSWHSKGRLGGQLGARTGKLGARKAQLGAQKASKRRLEARLGRPMGAWRPVLSLFRSSGSIAPEAPGRFIRIDYVLYILREFLGNEPSSQSLAHVVEVRFQFLVTISCS